MRAIVFDQPGDESVLHLGEVQEAADAYLHDHRYRVLVATRPGQFEQAPPEMRLSPLP